MSLAKVIQIISEENNEYTIFIPGIGNVKGQCISADIIQPGTPVRIVDLNNQPPNVTRQAGFRFLPNIIDGQTEPKPLPNVKFPPYTLWKTPDEMNENPNSLVVGYFFSSEQNRRWQKEYPLYKKGYVQKIIDENYMEVFIYGDTTRKCLCVYMTCNTAAFSEEDEVVIFYENGDFNSPVAIGFWNDPIDCLCGGCEWRNIHGTEFYQGYTGNTSVPTWTGDGWRFVATGAPGDQPIIQDVGDWSDDIADNYYVICVRFEYTGNSFDENRFININAEAGVSYEAESRVAIEYNESQEWPKDGPETPPQGAVFNEFNSSNGDEVTITNMEICVIPK